MKVIVNGAKGKMGSLACKTLDKHQDFELVAALGRGDHLAKAIAKYQADIVVDLTNAEAVYENSLAIIEEGAHPVIGSSGLDEQQMSVLHEKCKERKLGGIIVPNFSIAAVLMMYFSAIASKWMSEVEIIEAHHQQKLDAPSGTALKTAEMIARARSLPKNELHLKEILPGARGCDYKRVPIHSMRLPGVLAQQQVIFGQEGETLSITHNSIDRQSFMPGVVLACQKVSQLKSLYYGLEHLLDLPELS